VGGGVDEGGEVWFCFFARPDPYFRRKERQVSHGDAQRTENRSLHAGLQDQALDPLIAGLTTVRLDAVQGRGAGDEWAVGSTRAVRSGFASLQDQTPTSYA